MMEVKYGEKPGELISTFIWSGLHSGDRGEPIRNVSGNISFQIAGDFGVGGRVVIEVSKDATVYETANDRRRNPALATHARPADLPARLLRAASEIGRMPAPEGGAFDASTGFGRDERRHGGRVGGQRAQALIGAPCPEDGEVAAVGALGRHGLLCTREVGGAVERVAGRLLSATVKAGTCMFILGLGIRSAKQTV